MVPTLKTIDNSPDKQLFFVHRLVEGVSAATETSKYMLIKKLTKQYDTLWTMLSICIIFDCQLSQQKCVIYKLVKHEPDFRF